MTIFSYEIILLRLIGTYVTEIESFLERIKRTKEQIQIIVLTGQ